MFSIQVFFFFNKVDVFLFLFGWSYLLLIGKSLVDDGALCVF